MKSVAGTVNPTSLSLFFADFGEITKARLALSVVFSAVAGYLLGAWQINLTSLVLLTFGGYGMVAASNIYNQIIEKDSDALMHRTKNRPLPTGRMSTTMAMVIAVTLTVLGAIALYALNPKTAVFGLLSLVLYAGVYTPLKTKTPLAVVVGAFPGAIPFMLGWVAATDQFGIEPGTLFMIQFFWQFPHFWALGWILHEDYQRGGFKMLPTGKKDTGTALQIIVYTFWMILISILPAFGITGKLQLSLPAAAIVLLSGLVMLFFSFQLYKKRDTPSARRLMLTSVIYISVIQIIYVIDKFIT